MFQTDIYKRTGDICDFEDIVSPNEIEIEQNLQSDPMKLKSNHLWVDIGSTQSYVICIWWWLLIVRAGDGSARKINKIAINSTLTESMKWKSNIVYSQIQLNGNKVTIVIHFAVIAGMARLMNRPEACVHLTSFMLGRLFNHGIFCVNPTSCQILVRG